MAELDLERGQVSARILYWGIPGAGKSTNLQILHDRLRSDHRGDISTQSLAEVPGSTYELLPIELGEIGGLQTRLQIVTAPAGPEAAAARQHLLAEADGIVLVIDSRRECAQENLAAFEELRGMMRAARRSIDEMPLVIQYNKRDLSQEFDHELLHRKLGVPRAAAFEAVAPRGVGVLPTLSTVSKRVVRSLRERGPEGVEPVSRTPHTAARTAPTPAPGPETEFELTDRELDGTQAAWATQPSPGQGADEPELLLHDALDADDPEVDRAAGQARNQLEAAWPEARYDLESADEELKPEAPLELEIAQVTGAHRVDARSVRVDVVLRDENGRSRPFALTVRLDALTEPESDA